MSKFEAWELDLTQLAGTLCTMACLISRFCLFHPLPKQKSLLTGCSITYKNTALSDVTILLVIIVTSYFQDDGYIEMDITSPSPMLPVLPDSPSPTGFNESTMSQSMWTEEIEYVDLEKGDRGLGFSILDYKVSLTYRTN